MRRILRRLMHLIEYFCGLLLAVLVGAALWRGYSYFHERQLRQRPFPESWRHELWHHVPLYRRLPPAWRAALHELINVFLATKHFEGAAGLPLTDPMRLRIAAVACVLLLNRKTRIYPRLRSIIVYPTAFTVPTHVEFSPGHHLADQEDRLGESWRTGAVVLSWQTIEEETRHPSGRNLILHEFAHQLDMENGAADGIPALGRLHDYAMYARTLQAAYQNLRQSIASGRFSPIDPYAAKSEAEFFSVTTELFFEQPSLLRQIYPELYEQFRRFYCQDPECY